MCPAEPERDSHPSAPLCPAGALSPLPVPASEMDQWGAVSSKQTWEKIGCGGLDSLFPALSTVPTELMAAALPKFAAYQGLDTPFRAVEVYAGKIASLMNAISAVTASVL